jgi:hypothetical protein
MKNSLTTAPPWATGSGGPEALERGPLATNPAAVAETKKHRIHRLMVALFCKTPGIL